MIKKSNYYEYAYINIYLENSAVNDYISSNEDVPKIGNILIASDSNKVVCFSTLYTFQETFALEMTCAKV